MRRFRAALAVTAAPAICTIPLAAASPASAAELLTNGAFESGALSPWSCSGSTGSVVGTPVHTGTKALHGAATSADDAQCTQTVPVVSGAAYTLTAWVRGNYVFLGVTGGASTWTPSATGWTQLTVTFTASSSSGQVFLPGWYGPGDYYVDDVSLQGQGGSGPTVPGTPG